MIDTPPGGYLVAPQTRTLIDVEHGRACVTDSSDEVPTDVSWRVEIDMSTLTDLIFGLTTLRHALREHKLTLSAGCAEADADILFSALTINGQWYTPPFDQF